MDEWMGKDCHTVDCKINTRAQHTQLTLLTHTQYKAKTQSVYRGVERNRYDSNNNYKSRRGERRTREREFPGAGM